MSASIRLAIVLSCLALSAHAQEEIHLIETHAPNEGVVVSVDKAAKEIVIRHGRLNEFEMPPMTMAFEVADAALLDTARAGDRIWFRAEILNGRFTVTEIRRAGR